MESEVIPILREIRDEARATNARLAQVETRLGQADATLVEIRDEARATNARLGIVETALFDVAEQQRFVVRYLRALGERDRRLDDEVDALRRRIDRIEDRLGPE
jgi:chromosome segregation ATPase